MFNDYSLVMRPMNSERQANLWAIKQEGKILKCVSVRMLDLQWGGIHRKSMPKYLDSIAAWYAFG